LCWPIPFNPPGAEKLCAFGIHILATMAPDFRPIGAWLSQGFCNWVGKYAPGRAELEAAGDPSSLGLHLSQWFYLPPVQRRIPA